MAEEVKQGANGDRVAPADSPPANTPTDTGTEPKKVPFDQDESLQYVIRQVVKQVKETQTPTAQNQPSDKLSKHIDGLSKRLGLSESEARVIAETIRDMANDISTEKVAPLQKDTQTISISNKINSFATTHPDLYEHQKEMKEVFNSLSEEEQNYYLNSPKGIEMIYYRARGMKQSSPTTTQDKIKGSSPATASSSKESNITSAEDRASKALRENNKEAYNEAMKEILSGR